MFRLCGRRRRFGGNDVGSIMIEENVVSAAGGGLSAMRGSGLSSRIPITRLYWTYFLNWAYTRSTDSTCRTGTIGWARMNVSNPDAPSTIGTRPAILLPVRSHADVIRKLLCFDQR
jgi:hypothetical protein